MLDVAFLVVDINIHLHSLHWCSIKNCNVAIYMHVSPPCENLVKFGLVTKQITTSKSASCRTAISIGRPLFGALAFRNELQYHNVDFRMLYARISLHRIETWQDLGQVTPELTTFECLQQASIITDVCFEIAQATLPLVTN